MKDPRAWNALTDGEQQLYTDMLAQAAEHDMLFFRDPESYRRSMFVLAVMGKTIAEEAA